MTTDISIVIVTTNHTAMQTDIGGKQQIAASRLGQTTVAARL